MYPVLFQSLCKCENIVIFILNLKLEIHNINKSTALFKNIFTQFLFFWSICLMSFYPNDFIMYNILERFTNEALPFQGLCAMEDALNSALKLINMFLRLYRA